jgi:hypothetical protein
MCAPRFVARRLVILALGTAIPLGVPGALHAGKIPPEIADCQDTSFDVFFMGTPKSSYPKAKGKHRYAKTWNRTRNKVFRLLKKAGKLVENGKGPRAPRKIQQARNVLFKNARKFLDFPIPDEQTCDGYLARIAAFERLLQDSGLSQCQIWPDAVDRLNLLVLEECLALAGLWTVRPVSGFQTCTASEGPGQDVSWEEDEDTGAPETYDFLLSQSAGGNLIGSYPELGAGILRGKVEADGFGGFPFRFDLESTDQEPTPDCAVFMQSAGQDTIFGSPFCLGFPCIPKECHETEEIVGAAFAAPTSCPEGNPRNAEACADVQQSWTIGVTFEQISPDGNREISVACEGMATSKAEKIPISN